MIYVLFLDVSPDHENTVHFHVPETGGPKDEPDIPLAFGAHRVRVEIDVPHPYRPDGLMAYIEDFGEGLIHLPPSKGGAS